MGVMILKRILVVDDEKFIRLGIKRMIETERPGKYEVILARNGLEAKEIIVQNWCDMVLTDISMPFGDGIELIRFLAHMDRRPVTVIISGYDRFSYAVEGMRNGVADYLLKPISPEDIAKLLDKYDVSQKPQKIDAKQEKELLQSEIGRAILDVDLPAAALKDITLRVREWIAGEQIVILCLRIQSMPMRARIEERLKARCGDRFLMTQPIGKWTYIIMRDVQEICEEIQEQAVYAGRRTCPAFENLTEECRAAKQGAKRAFLTEARICEIDRAESQTISFEPALTELEYRLASGNMDGFRHTFEKTWSPSARRELDGQEFTRQIRRLLDYVDREAPDAVRNYTAIRDRLQDPYSMNSWEEFKHELFGYIYIVMNSLKEKGRGGYTQPVRDAVEFIQKNYGRDINLALVANYVGANYSVLSRIFSEQVGDSFVHYLKKCRIEAAKELLLTTDLPSFEIGHKVGYQNDRQYVKVFKEIVGITPNEYRKLHEKR